MRSHELEDLLNRDFKSLSKEEKLKLIGYYLDKLYYDLSKADDILGIFIRAEMRKGADDYYINSGVGEIDVIEVMRFLVCDER